MFKYNLRRCSVSHNSRIVFGTAGHLQLCINSAGLQPDLEKRNHTIYFHQNSHLNQKPTRFFLFLRNKKKRVLLASLIYAESINYLFQKWR
jgi:hypothetical protein